MRWVTASELNNDLFSVERSETGEKFTEILAVKGAGTKSSESVYSVYDQLPKPGITYYRLKQTDYSGVFTYSRIVKVDMPSRLFWSIYPNPVAGSELNVRMLEGDLGNDVQIRLSDASGHELFTKVIQRLATTDITIDLEQKLSAGVYILSVATGNQIVREKVVIKGN